MRPVKNPRRSRKRKGWGTTWGPPSKVQGPPRPTFWSLGQILQNPFLILRITLCNLANIFINVTWHMWVHAVNSTSTLPSCLKIPHVGRPHT